jgi:DNA-binding CsgD family transcriptional regulator
MRQTEREAVAQVIEAATTLGDQTVATRRILYGLTIGAQAEVATQVDHFALYDSGQMRLCSYGAPEQTAAFERVSKEWFSAIPFSQKIKTSMRNERQVALPRMLDPDEFLGSAVGRKCGHFVYGLKQAGVDEYLMASFTNRNGHVQWGLSLCRKSVALKHGFKKRAREFIAWMMPLVSRVLANLDEWSRQRLTLEALWQNTSELAGILVCPQNASPRWDVQTRALQAVLGTSPAASRELAGLAAQAAGMVQRDVNWKAPNGRSCRIAAIALPNSGGLLVRLLPLIVEADPVELYGFALKRGLSSREAEILLRLMDGLSNKEIAHRLFISVHTVHSHVAKIYRKLGVYGRIEAINLLRNQANAVT